MKTNGLRNKKPTLGEIAYAAAAVVTNCAQPWEEANQDKWEAAAEAVAMTVSDTADDDEIRLALIIHIKEHHKTQRNFAGAVGISQTFLSDVLNGRRDVTPKLAEAVGYIRHSRWHRAAKGRK